MLSTSEAVRTIVALKARMIFRGSTAQVVFTAIGMFLAIAIAIGIAAFVVFTAAPDPATISMIILALISLMWLIGSITFGGGEQVLDPVRLVLLPMSTRTICVSFFAAAFVGALVPGASLVAFATLRHANSILGALVMLLAAVATIVTTVLSGRVGVVTLATLVRGRKTKDIAAGLTAIVAVGAGVGTQFASAILQRLTEDVRASFRGVLRWTPWGWAPESLARASEGRFTTSLLFLLASTGFILGLLGVWVRLMNLVLQSKESNSEASIDGELVPAWMRFFPRTTTVAVAARTMRQLRRDPRELLQLASILPLAFVIGLPAFEAVRSGEPDAVLLAGTFGPMAGVTVQGVFGTDGRSFGVDALALDDLTPVVTGKALARIAIAVPLIFVAAVLLAAVTGGWSRVVVAFCIGVVSLLTTAAVGANTSVRHAQPLPDKAGSLNQSTNQGCFSGVAVLGSMMLGYLLAAVVVLPTVLLTIFVSPLAGTLCGIVALAYGAWIFRLGTSRAGDWANRNRPEMFQKLSAHT